MIVSWVETLLRSQQYKPDLPSKVKAEAALIAKQQSHDPQKAKEKVVLQLLKLLEERHAPSTGNAKLLGDELRAAGVPMLPLWKNLLEKEGAEKNSGWDLGTWVQSTLKTN